MTIYLGNLWREKENHLEFDSTHWTQFINLHEGNQDEINRYTFPNRLGPIGRIGTDGLRVLSKLPLDQDGVGVIIDNLDKAMDGHNPSLMSILSELIQNAMDQNATQIRLGYSERILTFAHDGTSESNSSEPFNARQLIQIFNLGSGIGKRNSIASEGRFGIGFKYWKTKFRRLVVRAKYSNSKVLRIDINDMYELDSIGLAINEDVEPEVFKTGESTLFEFHIPKDKETEDQCNDIIENLDERILRSLPMMAARNGGQIAINIGDKEIGARLETVLTDGNHTISTFKQDDGDEDAGIITEFSIPHLLDRWEPHIEYFANGHHYRRPFKSDTFLGHIRTFMRKLHSKWDESKDQNLEAEFNESKLRLCFRFDDFQHGMAGSLFVAPDSRFNLPCDVQAPWLLTDDRKAIHHSRSHPYNLDKIKWNNVLVELAYRAFLDSTTLMASISNDQISRSYLQQILALPLTLSEQKFENPQKVHTSISTVESLLQKWYGVPPYQLRNKNLGNRGLAVLMQYLLNNNLETTLDHLSGVCPKVLLIPSEEEAFLPVFDWDRTTDDDGNYVESPSVTVYEFDTVIEGLIDGLRNEGQEQENQIDPSFVECFGTLIVNDLTEGEVFHSFYESAAEQDFTRCIVDEFPISTHGKEFFKQNSELNAQKTYRLPTKEENFGRDIPQKIQNAVELKNNQIRKWLKYLHKGTYDVDTRQALKSSENIISDIHNQIELWSEESHGLLEDFIIIINSSREFFSFAFIPSEDEKWIHLRGSKYAYGGKVRISADLNQRNSRLLQLNDNSELGVYEFGIEFSNTIPLPDSMMSDDSVWANQEADSLAINGNFNFGRIRSQGKLEGCDAMFASAFAINSILEPLVGDERIAEVRSRLNLLFVDFIPLERGGENHLAEIKKLLPNVENSLNPYDSYHNTREYTVSTEKNPFGVAKTTYTLDLVTHLLHNFEIPVKEVGNTDRFDNFSTHYSVNWKVEHGVLNSQNNSIKTGLIVRVYGVESATEDRLWRTLEDDADSRAMHVLEMSRTAFIGQEENLWKFEQAYSVYYEKGKEKKQALVNFQKIGAGAAVNGVLPENLVGEEFTLTGPAFQTLRELRIATFYNTSLRIEGGGNGWKENRQSTNQFLLGQLWLPLPLNDSWDIVNQILETRETFPGLPLPVPVTDTKLFNIQNIPTHDPLRTGVDSLIGCLETNETSELALKWLELLLSEGMGTGGIVQSLREKLAPLNEIGRIDATSHPNLINCMRGPAETPEETYNLLLSKIAYGLADDEAILNDLKAPRLWRDDSGWSTDFSRAGSIQDFTQNNEREWYMIDIKIGIHEVLPSETFDIDDNVEIYVLPGFPREKMTLIANAIGDRLLSLKELAGNGISEQEAEDSIKPDYMSPMPDLPQVSLQIRERTEDNNPVRLGSFSPRLTHKNEDNIDHICWCNPNNEPVSLDQHRWVGRVIFSVLEVPIEKSDDLKHVLKQTSCVLVDEIGADEDERNNFQVHHVPSSLNHALKSFLDSLNSENIHDKLDKLRRNWISIPDPQAVMSCGLDKVQDWYVGLPGLSERDFIADDKMDRWVTVLYGSENGGDNSKRWMNLDTNFSNRPASYSKLKDNPCNRFLCSYHETKHIRRFRPNETDSPWNFFSSDVGEVAEYMHTVLCDQFPDDDPHIKFDGLLHDGTDDIPIFMHKWHAVLMCGWLMAWSP